LEELVSDSELLTPTFKEVRGRRVDYGSQFEILVSYIYHHLVGAGANVVDGGANAGLHAMPLRDLVGPSGRLTCFEPSPQPAAALRRNLADAIAAGYAEVRQEALGHENSTMTFIIDPKNPALSRIMSHLDRPREDEEKIAVPVVRLDDALGDRRIDFIKLDLEGYDFNALRGAEGILSAARPPVVFENSRAWAARRFGYTADDFFGFFDRIGYLIWDLHNVALVPESWAREDMAFEFVALHREDPRIGIVRRAIQHFWRSLDERPPLADWSECVMKCRKPIEYVGTRIE
jgi:FkbM family methyltransferase